MLLIFEWMSSGIQGTANCATFSMRGLVIVGEEDNAATVDR